MLHLNKLAVQNYSVPINGKNINFSVPKSGKIKSFLGAKNGKQNKSAMQTPNYKIVIFQIKIYVLIE